MASFEEGKARQPDREKFRERERDANDHAKEAVFIEWLRQNGARFEDAVELRSYDEEVRGVHVS